MTQSNSQYKEGKTFFFYFLRTYVHLVELIKKSVFLQTMRFTELLRKRTD